MIQLGVVTALPVEARCLLDGKVKPGQRVAYGLPGNQSWLQLSGMGPRNARLAAESLLESGVTALISWGVAAGLSAELHCGGLVLPKKIITADGRTISVDEAWHGRVYECLSKHIGISTGNLAETTTALVSSAEKAVLFRRTDAVAADMESAAIGLVAQQAEIPFLVVRAVVDGYTTHLPPAALAAMDMHGKFQPWPWLKSVLQNPSQLPSMLTLAQGLFAARATLVKTVQLAGPNLLVQAAC